MPLQSGNSTRTQTLYEAESFPLLTQRENGSGMCFGLLLTVKALADVARLFRSWVAARRLPA